MLLEMCEHQVSDEVVLTKRVDEVKPLSGPLNRGGNLLLRRLDLLLLLRCNPLGFALSLKTLTLSKTTLESRHLVFGSWLFAGLKLGFDQLVERDASCLQQGHWVRLGRTQQLFDLLCLFDLLLKFSRLTAEFPIAALKLGVRSVKLLLLL